MPNDFSLLILKPDAIARGLGDEIERGITSVGLSIIIRQNVTFDIGMLKAFYNWDVIYEPSVLEEYLCGAQSIIWIVRGVDAILKCLTYKRSLRMAMRLDRVHTLLHCSDSLADFNREYRAIFGEDFTIIPND